MIKIEEFVFLIESIDNILKQDDYYNIVKEYNNEYIIDSIWFNNKELNKDGKWIGEYYYHNLLHIKRNNPRFLTYINELKMIRKNISFLKDLSKRYKYNEIKSKLEIYSKIEQCRDLAIKYLDKLEQINKLQNNKYNKVQELLKEYEKYLIKPTKWNYFCDESSRILLVLNLFFVTPIFITIQEHNLFWCLEGIILIIDFILYSNNLTDTIGDGNY